MHKRPSNYKKYPRTINFSYIFDKSTEVNRTSIIHQQFYLKTQVNHT